MRAKSCYLILFSLFVFVLISCDSERQYKGTVLNNHDSYRFALKYHSNRLIDSGNHGSNVAILSFLFTECTDVCPIITNTIRKSLSNVPDSDKIPVIIVSVDPENDSLENRNQFIKKWNLDTNWSFISGTREDLTPIWNSYFINPQKYEVPIQKGGVEGINNALLEKETVIHSSPVYILNDIGVAKLVHTNPIDKEALTQDIIRMKK